jgi:hypothetical protein
LAHARSRNAEECADQFGVEVRDPVIAIAKARLSCYAGSRRN